jgi:signal transduction histidine kinase
VGRPIPEVLRSELAEADAEQLLDHLDAAGHVLTVATQQTAAGTTVEVEASVISLRDEHGAIVGYVSINRDVSMRRRLETRLHQTRHLEMVGRLAGGVAHDLNTLLTAIMGFTELTLGDRGLPPHIRPDLQQILAATERAGTLTRQLLAFSRAQQLSPRELDLNQLVASTVAARRRLAVKAVELVDRPAPDPVTVRVDLSQLERALLDIVANAGEAMADGGRLTVETDHVALDLAEGDIAAGQYARLSVTDTGVGMDEPTRLRACEPFFTTKPGHTGLGLSSVHGIVYQSGGHLKLDSAPGAGTTVTILLPLSPPA